MFTQLKSYFAHGLPHNLLNGFILFAIVMIVGFFIKYSLQTFGRRITSKTETNLDNQLLDAIIPRLKWLAIVIGLYLAIEEIASGIPRTDQTSRQIIQYTQSATYLAFIFLITLFVIRITDIALKYLIHQHAYHASPTLKDAILPLLNRIAMIVIFFIAVVIGLEHFNINVSSLLVFLGGGSVAIALAAQETLANMIAGFVITIDQPFRVGDRIKLPTGEIGDVYEIGLRSTTILDLDNNLIVSPNADLTKSKIINFSYPDTEIRVIVEIGVAYGTSIEQARKTILEIARKNNDLLKQPVPEVLFTGMGEHSCMLQLIARSDDWRKKGRAETTLREQIYTAFQNEGITLGYAAHMVHITTSPSNVLPKND
jgi:MscS family membrane protein